MMETSVPMTYIKGTGKITYVERPGTKEYNQQYPTVMSYDEYLEYIDMESFKRNIMPMIATSPNEECLQFCGKHFHYNAVNFIRISRHWEDAMPGEHSATGHKFLIATRTLPRI